MRRIYKARVISAADTQVTYEYTDEAGFVQISAPPPGDIGLSPGDTVHITVEDGNVIAVSKHTRLMSTSFGMKLAGVLFNGTPVKDTIKKLMGRPSKNETENEFLS